MEINRYSAEKVKRFTGREGYGFNAELHKDGKKVALVSDMADGGPFDWTWLDRGTNVTITVKDYEGKDFNRRMTLEESLFNEAIKNLTYICPFDGKSTAHNDDTAFDTLITGAELTKKAKKVTIFTIKGDIDSYRTIKHVYDDKVLEYLQKKHGDNLGYIFNRDGIEVLFA